MDNSFLKQEVIGKEFDDKLNELMYEHFAKRKFTKLGFLPRPGAIAMVHTLEDGMVKSVGASEPNDIINDNFGKWLGAHFSGTPSNIYNDPKCNIGQGTGIKDITGVVRTGLFAYNQGSSYWCRSGVGFSYIQIGSGITPPEVDDFLPVETPFANGGVEDNRVVLVNPSGYAPTLGRVNCATNIGPTTGSGTINEMSLQTIMYADIGNISQYYLMSHDTISPGLPFGIGETIFAQYFFQL